MNFSALRQRMVQEQLAARGINDPRVLSAFNEIPRHKFVSEKYQERAYQDSPLPIGSGQTISQPFIAALMTQYLELSAGDTVLEIGTGSGYQAAILAKLVSQVYSIERVPKLAKAAQETLKELGCGNVEVIVADGTLGWPDKAAYQAIIVTAAAPIIPQPLLAQLADEGRLIAPIGSNVEQILTVAKREGKEIKTEQICGCTFVPLIGKFGWKDLNA